MFAVKIIVCVIQKIVMYLTTGLLQNFSDKLTQLRSDDITILIKIKLCRVHERKAFQTVERYYSLSVRRCVS